MKQDATVREVLAEVTMLDLWAAVRGLFSLWGCLGVFFLVSLFLGSIGSFVTGSEDGFGIPSWAVWLFLIWILIGGYTENHSYHEHRIAWYFPQVGWIGALPLAAYCLVGFQIIRSGDPDASFTSKALHFALIVSWWLPLALAILILEIGHGRLMEKRRQQSS